MLMEMKDVMKNMNLSNTCAPDSNSCRGLELSCRSWCIMAYKVIQTIHCHIKELKDATSGEIYLDSDG